jgi:lipopolysaccharide export system protein LptC
MSELADRQRAVKRSWAEPGSFHDYLVRLLKFGLPAAIGVLLAYLALAPLAKGPEISFLLDKNKVGTAQEKMRIRSAQYRGQDNLGRPFMVSAGSAVQASSSEPVVQIQGMSAEILLEHGPARITGDRAVYNLETQTVTVAGPVRFQDSRGYRLNAGESTIDLRAQTLTTNQPMAMASPDGRRVEAAGAVVDLNERRVMGRGGVLFTAPDGYRMQVAGATVDLDEQRMVGDGPVSGRVPIGEFRSGRVMVDVDERRVVLDRGARLHIEQGKLR